MKITHNKIGQNLNISDAKEGNKSSGVGKSDSKTGVTEAKTLDKAASGEASTPVRFSEQAQLAAKATEVAKNSPEVRADKVSHYKELISKGQYQVDTDALAEKLLNEHLEF